MSARVVIPVFAIIQVCAVGVSIFVTYRAERDVAEWHRQADGWREVADKWREAAITENNTGKMWRDAADGWKKMAVDIAKKTGDDLAVCVSMLPADQRKSLQGK